MMITRNLRFVPLVAVLTSILSGCSLMKTGHDAEPPCNGFDVAHTAEVLGSGDRLRTELENAAKKAGPVRLIDITRAAGWSDDWTRMVEVRNGTNTRELNFDAKARETCWRGLPPLPDSDRTPPTYYLFLKGEEWQSQPVQSIYQSIHNEKVLHFGDRRALTAETVLIASGKSLTPEP